MKKEHKVVMLLANNEKAIEGQLMLYPSTNELVSVSRPKYGNKLFEAGIKYSSYSNCKLQHLYILSDDKIKEGDWVYNFLNKQIRQVTNKEQSEYYTQDEYIKKIIATTDLDLCSTDIKNTSQTGVYIAGLPKIGIDFVERYVKEYNQNNIIESVMLQYNEVNIIESPDNYDDNIVIVNGEKVFTWSHEEPAVLEKEADKYRNKLRIRSNGTVVISPVAEKMYSKEVVLELLHSCWVAAVRKQIDPNKEIGFNKFIKENLK